MATPEVKIVYSGEYLGVFSLTGDPSPQGNHALAAALAVWVSEMCIDVKVVVPLSCPQGVTDLIVIREP